MKDLFYPFKGTTHLQSPFSLEDAMVSIMGFAKGSKSSLSGLHAHLGLCSMHKIAHPHCNRFSTKNTGPVA